jgi:preprotein translocase subunit SecB
MTTQGNNNQMESGFRIVNLILLESNFKRVPNVTFTNESVNQNINVDVNVNVKDSVVFVTEKIHYIQSFNSVEEVDCTIVMAGVFEKIGTTELEDLEQFGYINGAAIIFPYIREHLSSLSSKAGLGLIILPPVNFTKKQETK